MALITKLNEEVTDETLPKLGYLRYYPQNTDGSINSVRFNNGLWGVKVEFIGDGYLCDSSGNEIPSFETQVNDVTFYYKSTGGFVQISKKYDLSYVAVSVTDGKGTFVDIDELDHCTQMNYFSVSYGNSYGHLKSINVFKDTATVNIRSTLIVGDLSEISHKKFVNLSIRYMRRLTGDLSEMPLDVASAYNSIEFNGCLNISVTAQQLGKFVNATSIIMTTNNVTYSDIADALFANGKVSGSVSIRDGSSTKTCTFTSSGWTAT